MEGWCAVRGKFKIWSVVLTLIIGSVLYFFLLPPINVTSIEFWVFLMMLLFLFIFLTFMDKVSETITKIKRNDFKGLGKLMLLVLFIPVMIMVVNFILSPIFNSRAFSKRIAIIEDTEESNFITDVKEIDFNSPTPLIVEFTQQTNSIPQHYEQIINQYLRGPASADLISPFPAEIQLKAFEISSNQSSITLSYYTKNFSNSRRTIAFACLTKTLVSLTGINAVEIIVEDMDSDAQEIFNFSIDSFLYIDSVSYDEITDK